LALPTPSAGWYDVAQGGTLKVTARDGRLGMETPKSGDTEWRDGEAPGAAVKVGKTPVGVSVSR
jgi:hypothetical protein